MTRSIRLPAAPPMTNASPSRRQPLLGRERRRIHRQTDQRRSLHTAASTAVLNGKSTPFSNPNAAPVLCTRVRLKKPGMTVMLSYSSRRGRTSAFTTWSSDDDERDDPRLERVTTGSSRQQLTGSAERVDAAVADARPVRLGPHARDEAPAALALHARRLLDLDAHLVRRRRPRRPCSATSDTIEEHRQLGAMLLRAARRRARAVMTTRAPSDVPITLSLRFSSSAALTVSRTPSSAPTSRADRASDEASTVGNSSRCTDSARAPGQVPPQLVRGDRQDRRQQPRQPVARSGTSPSASNAARATSRAQRVHPVLGHVHVERAEVDGRQRVQRLRDGRRSRTRRRRAASAARLRA